MFAIRRALCASLLLIFPLRLFSIRLSSDRASLSFDPLCARMPLFPLAAVSLSLSLFPSNHHSLSPRVTFFRRAIIPISLCVCHSTESRLYISPSPPHVAETSELVSASFSRRHGAMNERAFSSDYLLIIGRVKNGQARGRERRHLCLRNSIR